jgi:translation initiation factor IF-3
MVGKVSRTRLNLCGWSVHLLFLYPFSKFREVETISKQQYLINEEIRDKEIRVQDSEGEVLGIMPTKEALAMAEQKQLDLVMIAPQAIPPVCRIMDFGKFIYEGQKKDKETKKKQKVVVIKEIRISPTIEDHDLNVKAKNAEKFLKDGDKVKVTVRFRGREADYAHFGNQLLARFAEKLSEVSTVEKSAKLEGKNMFMFLAPKKV